MATGVSHPPQLRRGFSHDSTPVRSPRGARLRFVCTGRPQDAPFDLARGQRQAPSNAPCSDDATMIEDADLAIRTEVRRKPEPWWNARTFEWGDYALAGSHSAAPRTSEWGPPVRMEGAKVGAPPADEEWRATIEAERVSVRLRVEELRLRRVDPAGAEAPDGESAEPHPCLQAQVLLQDDGPPGTPSVGVRVAGPPVPILSTGGEVAAARAATQAAFLEGVRLRAPYWNAVQALDALHQHSEAVRAELTRRGLASLCFKEKAMSAEGPDAAPRVGRFTIVPTGSSTATIALEYYAVSEGGVLTPCDAASPPTVAIALPPHALESHVPPEGADAAAADAAAVSATPPKQVLSGRAARAAAYIESCCQPNQAFAERARGAATALRASVRAALRQSIDV